VRIGPNYSPDIEEFSLDFLSKTLSSKEEIELFKHQMLRDSDIVAGTLSATGMNILLNLDLKFDSVIIDESAQSCEISNLIPLKYKCLRLILVGDPLQLPATVFSQKNVEMK